MREAVDSQKVLFSSYLSFYHCYITCCLIVVPKVTQVFSSAAGNCFFTTTKTAELHLPEHKQLCVTIQEFKRRINEKKPTQISQVINSGKTAAGHSAAPTSFLTSQIYKSLMLVKWLQKSHHPKHSIISTWLIFI